MIMNAVCSVFTSLTTTLGVMGEMALSGLANLSGSVGMHSANLQLHLPETLARAKTGLASVVKNGPLTTLGSSSILTRVVKRRGKDFRVSPENMLEKKEIHHQGLYICVYTPKDCRGHILYVHGGPGSHSAHFEEALKTFEPYRDSKVGWVCYDQRGCGRSDTSTAISHSSNIRDLKTVVEAIKQEHGISLLALAGHSYGAWLLYDAIKEYPELTNRAIFIGRAINQSTSRTRSLLMSLLLLKIEQPEKYEELLKDIEAREGNPFYPKMDKFREALLHPEKRNLFYWGNMEAMRWLEGVKRRIGLKDNDDVARQIAETHYQAKDLVFFDYASLGIDVLLVNGFHDFLMAGEQSPDIEQGPNVSGVTFYRSGHYPHFEEPRQFVSAVERFVGY